MAEIIKQATLKNPAFWACLTLSIVLGVAGFIVPPLGHVDGSILTLIGLFFAFAALYEVHIAINKGVDAKLKHGSTEFAVGDFKEDTEQ